MTGGLSNNFLSNLLHVGFKLVIYFRWFRWLLFSR
jgi:hypothetical protein